jgi:hypothetical protein
MRDRSSFYYYWARVVDDAADLRYVREAWRES